MCCPSTDIFVIIAVDRFLVHNFGTLQHSGLFLNVTEVYFLFVRDSAITLKRQIAQFGRSLVCMVQVHCCFRSVSRSPCTLTLRGACACACVTEQPVTFQLHNLVSVAYCRQLDSSLMQCVGRRWHSYFVTYVLEYYI